jgi:hypothetical protein
MDTVTRITQLTPSNILALREVFPEAVFCGYLYLTATTATWKRQSPAQVLASLDTAMAMLPTRGHPRASLHAVRRKVAKLG